MRQPVADVIADSGFRLSKHDPADKLKYVDNPAMWESDIRMLCEVLQEYGLPFFEADGEAAFYGTKIDVQVPALRLRAETRRGLARQRFPRGSGPDGGRIQAKIRDAAKQKIPYMLVIGDKEMEMEANAVAVRPRDGIDLSAKPVADFVAMLHQVVISRTLKRVPGA